MALIVRHQSIAPSTKDPTPAEMNALVSRGALSLPDALASKVIDGRCEAFIYEFFRKTEDAPPVLVDNTTIGALKHLLGAGLWTQGELNK